MNNPAMLLGAAGEHYVLCQLLRRNFIAALAPQGVPNADIIITDHLGDRLCAIQVKARRDIGSDKGWHMKSKHQDIIGDRLFYCFVDFGKSLNHHPICYIIPSAIVAEAIRVNYDIWLKTPGKNGRAHKEHNLRRFLPDYEKTLPNSLYKDGWLEKYKENWDILVETAVIKNNQTPQQVRGYKD